MYVNSQYPTAFAINPSTPNTVYATTPGGVYKTTNGGNSWGLSSNGMPARAHIYYGIALRGSSSTLYTASQTWAIHRSTDAAANWSRADTGIQQSAVQWIAPHPTTAGTVFAAHNGGLSKSTNHGASWTFSMNGLPTSAYGFGPIAYRPDAPSIMYLGAQDSGLWQTNDGGATWFLSLGQQSGTVNTIFVDPANPLRVYIGVANQGVFASNDGASSFNDISAGLPQDYNVYALTKINNTMFVIESSGGVYRYESGSGTWISSQNGLPAGIQDLWTDPSGAGYASTYYDTYRSTDGGLTWSLYQPGVQRIVWDPTRVETAHLFRTYQGIYRTVDSFASSVPFNQGIPSDFFGRLGIDVSGGTLYYGAASHGLYRVTD
jgi:photosystem II stability/assembly factor-like uncharacterized protein